jgi:hypothetical protein
MRSAALILAKQLTPSIQGRVHRAQSPISEHAKHYRKYWQTGSLGLLGEKGLNGFDIKESALSRKLFA